MNRERIEETVRLWQAEPDKAKGKPTVIARAEGSKAVMEHGSFSWRTDMPVPLGGTNEAPSPTALLLSALAGCAVVFIRDTLAPQLGVTVDAIEATAQCETDARGLLERALLVGEGEIHVRNLGPKPRRGNGVVAPLT